MHSRPQTSGTHSYEITNQSTNLAALVPVVLSPITPMSARRPGRSEMWGVAESGAESGAIYTFESTNQAPLVPVNTPLAPVNSPIHARPRAHSPHPSPNRDVEVEEEGLGHDPTAARLLFAADAAPSGAQGSYTTSLRPRA